MDEMPWWTSALLPLIGVALGAAATFWQQRVTDRRQAAIRAEDRQWALRAEMKAALKDLRLAVDRLESMHMRFAESSNPDGDEPLVQYLIDVDEGTLVSTLNELRGLALEVGHPALREAFIDNLDLDRVSALYDAIYAAYEDVNRPQVGTAAAPASG